MAGVRELVETVGQTRKKKKKKKKMKKKKKGKKRMAVQGLNRLTSSLKQPGENGGKTSIF